MSLETGQYYITSADGGYPIGRSPVEDKSLNPKGIFKLPKRFESVWDVEKLANGNYTLRNKGAIVGGESGGKVFAYLIPEEATGPVTTEWKFIFDESRANEGAPYLIAEAPSGRTNGWVVPHLEDDEPSVPPGPQWQVLMRALIAGPRIPPFYPATQVFFFTKVEA